MTSGGLKDRERDSQPTSLEPYKSVHDPDSIPLNVSLVPPSSLPKPCLAEI